MKQSSQVVMMFSISMSILTLAYGAKANTVNLGEGHNPAISSDGKGHLFVVFEGFDKTTDAADIFYSSSNDGGRTWTRRTDVSSTSGVSTRPRVALEKSGAINVVWADTRSGENSPDIFFARSVDGGLSWTKPVDISNTPGLSRDPVITVGPDNTIHVAFTENESWMSPKDVIYTSSSDGGKTWRSLEQLENVSKTPGDSTEPAIAVGADGAIQIAWKDDSPGTVDPQIFYTQRNQGTWSTAINVSKSRRYCFHPVIAAGAAGKTYITWSERIGRDGAADILCMRSSINNPSQEPNRVTSTGSIASDASMTADMNDRVAVVWADRALGTGSPKICLRVMSSVSNGHNRYVKLAKSSAVHLAPEVAIDGNKLTVVWEERRDDKTPVKVRSVDFSKSSN